MKSGRGLQGFSRSAAVVALAACSIVAGAPSPSVAATHAMTGAVPSGKPAVGETLRNRMGALFRAIQLDSLPLGAALFFPEAAYVAMKHGEIANPRSDYVDRLVGFLRLDISAYHAYLTSRGRATFDGINANPSQVTWIAPGECENSIGYWHFPGVRLVFTQHHVVRSFAVASLLSWHDVWYVVHLGPNPRLRNVGAVDAPLQGRGVAGPSGGC